MYLALSHKSSMLLITLCLDMVHRPQVASSAAVVQVVTHLSTEQAHHCLTSVI